MSVRNYNENLYNVGVNYKKVDVHTRGKFSVSKENQIILLKEAKKRNIVCFILSTCNRTEITGFAEHPFQLIELLCKYSHGSVEEFLKISNSHKNKEAITHLFRIGTGLDSQILGDYEIVGQLRQAFKKAKELQTLNVYLERLLNSVMQASKRVKNETKLSSGTTSVSYAAIQYIIENVPSYNTKKIVALGLGKMGRHACKNLVEYTQNKSICLINRTKEKVQKFIEEYPWITKGNFTNLTDEIAKADVLIVSTGAEKPTVTEKHISANKKLLILDLSMPENVSENVKNIKNVTLVNVDDLSKITDETLAIRQQEIPKAQNIIKFYKNEFNEWLNHRKFTPAINALKESLEEIQQNEIAFYRKKIKNFNEEHAQIITSKFIQKITTQFVKHLKDEDTSIPQSISVIRKVFQTNI